MSQRIFFSFSRDDEAAATLLYMLLQKLLGSRDYIFKANEHRSGIEGGEDWRDRIRGELTGAGGLIALATPKFINERWFWLETGTVWVRDKYRILLFAPPSVEPNKVVPFDHKQIVFLDEARREMVKDALSKMCERVCGVTATWTTESEALLNAVLKATLAEPAKRIFDVAWSVGGEPTGTVTIAELPDLTDIGYAIARPFDDEELQYLRQEFPQDVDMAIQFNAAVDAAMKEQALRNQWLRSVQLKRYERANIIELQVTTGDEDVRDIVVSLTFPEQLEVFANGEEPKDADPPTLPKFPSLALAEKRKRERLRPTPLVYDYLHGTAILAELAMRKPRPISDRIRSAFEKAQLDVADNRRVEASVKQMSRRRKHVFEKSDAIRIAALGPPGDYKVAWTADAEGLEKQIHGELTVIVTADQTKVHQRGARDYFGPPLEAVRVEEFSASDEDQGEGEGEL